MFVVVVFVVVVFVVVVFVVVVFAVVVFLDGFGVEGVEELRPPTEVIVRYIDEHRLTFGVARNCTTLQIAPSTYYSARSRAPSARSIRDTVLKVVLLALWKANYESSGPASCGRRPPGGRVRRPRPGGPRHA